MRFTPILLNLGSYLIFVKLGFDFCGRGGIPVMHKREKFGLSQMRKNLWNVSGTEVWSLNMDFRPHVHRVTTLFNHFINYAMALLMPRPLLLSTSICLMDHGGLDRGP